MERYRARRCGVCSRIELEAVIQRDPCVAGALPREHARPLFPHLSFSAYFLRCIRKLTSILPGFTLHAVLRADIPPMGIGEPRPRQAPFSYAV